MQKKDPKYYDLKEETAWTMEQFKYLFWHLFYLIFNIFSDYINNYVSLNKKVEQDWVIKVLPVSFN